MEDLYLKKAKFSKGLLRIPGYYTTSMIIYFI